MDHLAFVGHPARDHNGLVSIGAIKKISHSGGVPENEPAWAVVSARGVLGSTGIEPGKLRASPEGAWRALARSGRPELAADDEAAASVASWGPGAWAAFDPACDELAPACARAGLTLVLVPRVGDVLSDVPSCLSFLRKWERGPFELAIAPSDLLTPSMRPRAVEHLERITEALLEHPKVCAAVVGLVDGEGRGVGPREGVNPPVDLGAFAERASAAGKIVIVSEVAW